MSNTPSIVDHARHDLYLPSMSASLQTLGRVSPAPLPPALSPAPCYFASRLALSCSYFFLRDVSAESPIVLQRQPPAAPTRMQVTNWVSVARSSSKFYSSVSLACPRDHKYTRTLYLIQAPEALMISGFYWYSILQMTKS